jgi:hypothetical protein
MPSNSPDSGFMGFMGDAIALPDAMTNVMLNLTYQFTSVLTVPIEMCLRPRFGSQYFSPIVVAIAVLLFQGVTGATALYQALQGYSSAPIGMGILTVALWGGCIYHAIRIRRLILDMDREGDSEEEGSALFIFTLLPRGDRWTWVRCFWEPLAVIGFSALVYVTGTLTPFTAAYLALCGVALFLKNYAKWYQSWRWIRGIRDKEYRAGIIARIALGEAPTQTIGHCVLAALPESSGPKERTAIAAHFSGLTPEMQSLLSPVISTP